MPEGAKFKKECKKVPFNSFVMMQFSLLDQVFFPYVSRTYLYSFIKSELDKINKNSKLKLI